MPESVRILLVEDDENDAELALRALSKVGVPGMVAHSRDGEEALDFLLGRGAFLGCPGAEGLRVILLDLKLPKLDGLEVLRTIRAEPLTRDLPVVMLTSSMLPSDVAACYRAGASSYVVKQVEFAAHACALQEIAAYWLRLNVVP